MVHQCRIVDLRLKEVINVFDGARLGFVNDVEVDILTGRVVALIVPGACRFFGLFGRGEEYVIPWDAIDKIGDDIILVRWECRRSPIDRKRKGFFAFKY